MPCLRHPRHLPFRASLAATTVVATTLAVTAVVVPGRLAAPARADEPVRYVPPVAAPIIDPFRPPDTPYGPGNRGLEYDTVPGTPVWASADGTVVFAGQVGGSLHVTIAHADGIRTTYSFLSGVDVVLGQPVRQGDRVGTAGEAFHFGARSGGVYIDPAGLFSGAGLSVTLLPLTPAPGPDPPPGRSPLAWLRIVTAALSCCW